MRCPKCFGDFNYLNDYCYFVCPYSFVCEDEYLHYDDYDDWWDDYWY